MSFDGNTVLDTNENSLDRVKSRESVVNLQKAMEDGLESGMFTPDTSTLNHYFAPVVDEYGCGTYAREIHLPKGSLVVGKIHRHAHINIISKGEVSVATEHGKKYYTAPCTFVSEVGLKRAVLVEEDTIWTTIHLTKHLGEDKLGAVEEEVIAESYEDIGLISSELELKSLDGEL
jgi:hypothetical protein